MKKAFDQTVREIKREVNKKVLKVPGIEQKVLDATSNEPWGPHGSLLADIAQSSRNYHEYQMIMAVIWKRISDTGKNWRHVYKALTVLEYLVAYGSERVIDEIRERAYQISTLSNFQYIDSSGKDQGNNVRKKSQSLIILVNDKEKIQEARQKAAANRDKYRNTSMGSMYRPSSYSGTEGYGDRFDDDHYEGRYRSRDDDRYDYGREREWGGYRDDDRYGRYGDSYGRDVDQYNRDRDEQYGRDGYRDDDYQGRSQSIDDYQDNWRSRSSDRERDRACDDDGQYSSRGRGGRTDDHSQDGSFSGRQLDRKSSEQNLNAPPSYEEAVGEARSPVQSQRDGETSSASIPKPFSSVSSCSIPAIPVPDATSAAPSVASATTKKEDDGFNEFDPRSSFSESFPSNTLAITLVTSASTTPEANASTNFSAGPTFAARPSPAFTNQPFDDPFGDGPFKAFPSTDATPTQPQNVAPISSFHPSTDWSFEIPQPVAEKLDSTNLGGTFPGTASTPSNNPNAEIPPKNVQVSQQEFPTSNHMTDILADILPPSGPSLPISQAAFPTQGGVTDFSTQGDHAAPPTAQVSQPASHSGFVTQSGQPQPQANFSSQPGHLMLQNDLMAQTGQPAPLTGFLNQNSQHGNIAAFPGQISTPSETESLVSSAQPAQPVANSYGNFIQPPGSSTLATSYMASQTNDRTSTQYNNADFIQQANPAVLLPQQTPISLAAQPNNDDMLGNFLPQGQPSTSMTSQPAFPASTGSLTTISQPAKDKFGPKSAVWADTLSRGLVNLNISGPKINPHSDIGIDFDAINRKEKRMEKPTAATVTSTITMGKAMGSGSGMGRLAAGALRPPPNPVVGSGIGMGMGVSPGVGMGMGGYGGLNQQSMGMGMGMAMNRPMNNMVVPRGVPMQPTGFPSGSNVPGGYNPMMGGGGYAPRPYGGGY